MIKYIDVYSIVIPLGNIIDITPKRIEESKDTVRAYKRVLSTNMLRLKKASLFNKIPENPVPPFILPISPNVNKNNAKERRTSIQNKKIEKMFFLGLTEWKFGFCANIYPSKNEF